MATYDIAPATTSSEIGMGQMRYGLSASADYNASNIYSAGSTDMQTLVSNSITYQPDLDSKTWNTSTPYGFAEMAGQTWSTAVTYSINYVFTNGALGLSGINYTIKSNGTTLISTSTAGSGTVTAAAGTTIEVSGSANASSGANLNGEFRQPAGSGGYTSLFTDSVGGGGGTLTGNGSFTLGSNNADVNITFS